MNHLYQPEILVSVNKSQISVIGVDLRNGQGEPFPFDPQAKVMLTLHFKRDFDCVAEPPPCYQPLLAMIHEGFTFNKYLVMNLNSRGLD